MPKEYSCVKKTKKMFEDALAELSKEYPLNKVTVNLLCERADLSRNAFYFHYKDINDLVKTVENTLIGEIESYLEDFRKLGFPDNILATIEMLINLFDENRENVLMLFDKSYSMSFTRRISEIFGNFNYPYFKLYRAKSGVISYELFYTFITYGFYESLRYWLNNSDTITKEDVKKMTYTMIKRLLVDKEPTIDEIAHIDKQ